MRRVSQMCHIDVLSQRSWNFFFPIRTSPVMMFHDDSYDQFASNQMAGYRKRNFLLSIIKISDFILVFCLLLRKCQVLTLTLTLQSQKFLNKGLFI